MQLKRFIATLLAVVVLAGLLPVMSTPASAEGSPLIDESPWAGYELKEFTENQSFSSSLKGWGDVQDATQSIWGSGKKPLGGRYVTINVDEYGLTHPGIAMEVDGRFPAWADYDPLPGGQALGVLHNDASTCPDASSFQLFVNKDDNVFSGYGSVYSKSAVSMDGSKYKRNGGFSVSPEHDTISYAESQYVRLMSATLYLSWRLWDKENRDPLLKDPDSVFANLPEVVVNVPESSSDADITGDWEWPGWDPVDIKVWRKDCTFITVDMPALIDGAFGDDAYETYHSYDKGLQNETDFNARRSQLAFLAKLFGETEFPIGTRLMTQEQQESMAANLTNDTIDALDPETASLLETAWVLQFYKNLYGLENDGELSGYSNTWWGAWTKDNVRTAFHGYLPDSLNPENPGAFSLQDAAIAVYTQYPAVLEEAKERKYPRTESTDAKMVPDSTRMRPQILAAYNALKEMTRSNDGSTSYQNTTDLTLRCELFVYRLYVAYGVMTRQLSEDALSFIALNPGNSDLILMAPAPTFMRSDKAYALSQNGAVYFLSVYNDFRWCVFQLVNNTADYITNPNSSNSLGTITDHKDAIVMMYNMLQDFDDESMWEVWRSTDMDAEPSSDGRRYSMADVYDFLAAQHAFDASLDPNGDGQSETPFGYFFNDEGLADSLKSGLRESAKFLPMQTNVYDPSTWAHADTAWLLNYYAKFGYFRKVLYIDTAQDAAVAFGNTGGRGQLAVATLEDLLQDKDVVLYLDDNLYNVNTLSELIGKSWDRLGQDDSQDSRSNLGKLGGLITGLWEISMPELAKTGEKTAYSTRLSEKAAKDQNTTWGGMFLTYDGDTAAREITTETDAQDEATDAGTEPEVEEQDVPRTQYAASTDSGEISYYLYPDYLWNETENKQVEEDDNGNVPRTTEYTPLFGLAVLSAVYKDNSLKNTLNSVLSSNTPVFVSSGSAPYVCDTLRTSIYNYMLLRNLEAQIPVDYAANLDMTSPLYMDVFGNILTESGYVVVPAAANATLWGSDYVPRNAAFFACYGDAWNLPVHGTEASAEVEQMLTGGDEPLFGKSEDEKVFVPNALRTKDLTVNVAMLSTANVKALDDVADTFVLWLKGGSYSLPKWKMIITEVLRGAPIESIDKQFEGIQTDVNYTRNGLIIADKLETLCNAIAPAGQNASLAIPNPAFIDGIEIIVFFVYKLLILAVLIIWMVNVYLDATAGTIGLKTGFKCIGVVVLVLALITGVPKIFEISYYESNKLLLQDETEYLLMLNTEKKANGQEIGVTKVRPPETGTTLYLHLADVEMPWWDLLSKIGLSAGYKSLDEMYKDHTNKHPLAYSEHAVTRNGGIYISTDQLFDSAGVQFSPLTKQLYITGDGNTPASYYTPYYWFLNCITDNISSWSKEKNAIAYTTKAQRGGELKTLGYSKLYFESEEFTDDYADYFHLYQLYDVTTERVYPQVDPDGPTMPKLRDSQWCHYNSEQISEQGYKDRIERLQEYAKMWVANNRGMIGRVSDETFLKCFALSCAMEHNRLFNTQRADYLEIQQLSNEDLLRLSIADHNKVMSNSSMSYARFVYTTGGTIACYLAAILEMVTLVSSWVKPACTLLVFCIACISIFVLKLILRKGNKSIMGYILTITLMCSVNVVGAAVTKLSMFLPSTGFTPALCILLQVVVQIAYIFLQLKIVSFALRDWRNIGYQQYEHQFNKLVLPGRNSVNISRNVLTPHGTTGYDALDHYNNRRLGRRIRK